jgi:MerR family mercuric resistance operon transcriptional regulator
MKISELGRASGVTVETIRYYHRRGLLGVPDKGMGAIREYGTDHLTCIRFIRRASKVGFTLEEIKRLISLSGTECEDVMALATAKLALVRQKLADLARIEGTLVAGLENCKKRGKNATCPILESFADDDTTPT